nr:MAG TPA: hypothetical protein [Caudoviricetes sp.]
MHCVIHFQFLLMYGVESCEFSLSISLAHIV